MFIDQITKKPVPPKTAQTRIVVETRPKTYLNPLIEEGEQVYDDDGFPAMKVTHGYETVQEIVVGPEGLRRIEAEEARLEKEAESA